MARCCVECFDDEIVRNFIASSSTRKGKCRFCGSKAVQMLETKAVAEFLRAGIDREYTSIGTESLPYEMAEFDTVADILKHEGVLSDLHANPSRLLSVLTRDMAPD